MIAQMWVTLGTWNVRHENNYMGYTRTHIELFEELGEYYVEVKEQQVYRLDSKELDEEDFHAEQRKYKSRNAAMNYVRKLLKDEVNK